MNNKQPQFELLRGMVGKPLSKLMSDFGCPALPNDLLSAEQRAFLQSKINGLPSDATELGTLLAKQAESGKLLRVGDSPDGESLLTVRVPLTKATAVVTFSYYGEVWKLENIEAVQTRVFEIGRALIGGVVGSAVTLLVAFFAWGGNSADVVKQAQKEGYVVLTQEQYAEVKKNESAAGEATVADAGQSAPAGNSAANTKPGGKVVFKLEEGMTTGDLTDFLKKEGLITNQASFNQTLTEKGIDTLLRPKAYEFKKGMSEQEILTVLQG